jgi:cell division protein ZapA|tara:strand:+ start:123 stop:569 length:447 start_codon:yes stop_codon:yes gene_type:complete
MANVNIKFNNKEYILSCDDGQEESLKKLTNFLDKKYKELKEQLGNIGENKLLLITTIKLVDDYFNLKQKVTSQKDKLNNLSKRYLEMKSLAIRYKENKDLEIEGLNKDINKFKKMLDESDAMYEAILDRTTKSLENIIKNTDLKSDLQ